MVRTEELHEIKELLDRMRVELLEDLEERIKSSDISTQREIGDIFDDADLEQSREFNLLLSKREQAKLDQIDAALARIKEGEYGICEDCEEEIPLGRLKAMPFAALCVKCKSERESIEGQKSFATGKV